jgi:ATP-dependent helicase HrpB
MQRSGKLPVSASIPDLARALDREGVALLAAPPGAGKTTLIPLALLEQPWLAGRRIIMLEPRRLAARAAARRMSFLLGESVGKCVGFRIRNETVVSDATRIEVVTEGVLTRIIQDDPALEEYGIVIFDEFHERNLHGDIGLALTLQARDVLREDLRILVMSATLDVEGIAAFLGGAAVVRSEGKSFPVAVQYMAPRREQTAVELTAGIISRALREIDGDVLVFLPGMGEIVRVQGDLEARDDIPAAIHVLHSSVSLEQQDAALRPAASGTRKVILATSIAETSLTIEGVHAVVDSGLSRVPRYSPRSGLTRLETVRVSRASAEQRAGRAGRIAPGKCYRLWDEHEQHGLLERAVPEILEADLAPLLLELAASGIRDASELRWLQAPPAAALNAARELLQQLGAVDERGSVTEHGKQMNRLALHPRLSHMVLAARALRLVPLACDVAALLQERDVLKAERSGEDVDLRTRVQLLNRARKSGAGAPARRSPANANAAALERVMRESERLRRATSAGDAPADAPADERAAGVVLAFAYPDRIAARRDAAGSRFLLRSGTGTALPMSQELSAAEMIVVADIDGRKPESRIWLAAPVDVEDIRLHFAGEIALATAHEWDESSRAVRTVTRESLGAIVLRETSSAAEDPDVAAQILLDQLKESRLMSLPWSAGPRSMRLRIQFLHHHDRTWPDISDAALLEGADVWLLPHLRGMRSMADLRQLDLTQILFDAIGRKRRAELDHLAPSHLQVPTGSRIAVDYSDPEAPLVSVRLQEMFGLADTPRVLGGMVPLTIQLLSPAGRPVQITRDLAGFWRTSYFEVRKEMRGRYPRHSWPEDPMAAMPTRRTKRRDATDSRAE